MKIFILVLIFSLFYNFNCKKNPGPQDDGQDLKNILTYKLKPLIQRHTKNKLKPLLIGHKLKKKLKDFTGEERDPVNEKLKYFTAEEVDPVKEKLEDFTGERGDPVMMKLEDFTGERGDPVKEKLENFTGERGDPVNETLQNFTGEKEDPINEKDADLKDIIKYKVYYEVFKRALLILPFDVYWLSLLRPLIQGHTENKKIHDFTAEEADQVPFSGGDVADLFGNNQHYKIPDNYQDFGRRFILQYPYTEKKSAEEEAEDDLHNMIKEYIKNKRDSKDPLPIKAPPEFVIDIAIRSLMLEESKPKNPTDDIIQKDILRSGNYWDDVRKEEADPKKILRSTNFKNDLESVKVQIKPGSKLYNLISILKEKSPRLLYVINKDFD